MQSLNALSFGHMWSSIFDNETQAMVTGFGVMNIIMAGMGLMVKPSSNKFVKLLHLVSPSSYTLELIFRRVMSKNAAIGFFVVQFDLTRGESHCYIFLMT